MLFGHVSGNSVTSPCNQWGWSYPVASSEKNTKLLLLIWLSEGLGMPEALGSARHFLRDYLKLQKCCEQEGLILNSALTQASDH